MKQIRTILCLALTAQLVSGCALERAGKVPKQNGAFREVAIGLCEDYPKESRSLSAARRDLELLKTNGIHVMRISFSWLDMEPAPGKYDWSFWDDFVRMASEEYGIRLIPYVCYTPRWASTSTNENYWQQPPMRDAFFSEFVTQLVSRYKKWIHSWEIWNEPDNPYYWRGSVEQFTDLLRAGAAAVREADPAAKVVMGGLAWNPDFLAAILANVPAISNVNVINLHNYYETWASEPLERIPAYVGRAYDLIREHGQNQPIWMAEVGYSDFRRGAYVSDEYVAHFQEEHTRIGQAAALFRVMTLAFAARHVSLLAWYRIHDLAPTQQVIGDENNRFLGVLDEDDRAKPALRALQFFRSLFPDGFRCIDDEVLLRKPISSPAEVHVFEKPDGGVIVAAWLRTYIPGTGRPASEGDTPDTREVPLSLELPFRTESHAFIFDELGKSHGSTSISVRRHTSGISDLLVEDGAVTVLKLRRAMH